MCNKICAANILKEILSFLIFFTYLSGNIKFLLQFIMKEGKVKFFNESKGFGFIKDSESDKEYFVHVSGLLDDIRENDDVTFELVEGRKGLNAVNVKLA